MIKTNSIYTPVSYTHLDVYKRQQKTFAKYKKCTEVYCSQYANGKSIERLTVAG